MECDYTSMTTPRETYVVNDVDVTRALEWQRGDCACGNGRRSTWFCPSCFVPIGVPGSVQFPRLHLPLDAIILRSTRQKKKGTGAHARVLAPDHVCLIDVGHVSLEARKKGLAKTAAVEEFDIQAPVNPQNCVILYPSKDSVLFSDIPAAELAQLRYMVFIDSTWNSTQAIMRSKVLEGMKHVRLEHAPENSRYWRVPPEGKNFLSTIEAMTLAYREFPLNPDVSNTDKLMYLFEHMLHVIETKRKEQFGEQVAPIYGNEFREEQRKKWYPNGARKNKRRRPQTIDLNEEQKKTKEAAE